MTYDAILKTAYCDAPTALALIRRRICAVTIDGGGQIGQARDFRLSRDGRLLCTIDCDDNGWADFQKASLDGATLFVQDYPVVGPVEARHGQDV